MPKCTKIDIGLRSTLDLRVPTFKRGEGKGGEPGPPLYDAVYAYDDGHVYSTPPPVTNSFFSSELYRLEAVNTRQRLNIYLLVRTLPVNKDVNVIYQMLEVLEICNK